MVYRDTLQEGAGLIVQFQGVDESIELPVGQAAQVALKILKTSSSNMELFYKQHAWLTIQACVYVPQY